jgi:nucleoside-diphosphate-sugar epimerase
MEPNRANIIITGSSGMIGSPLCAMLGATYNVVGFDGAGSPYPPIEVECESVGQTSELTMAETDTTTQPYRDYRWLRSASSLATRMIRQLCRLASTGKPASRHA